MNPDHRSWCIATALSSLWAKAKLPEFTEYVQHVYHVNVCDRPNFRCLYIGETEDGDMERGPMPGLIKQWWMVDDHGIREVRIPKLDWEGDSIFLATPEILFFSEGDGITIHERLGQRLMCWKSGQVYISDDEARVVDLALLDV